MAAIYTQNLNLNPIVITADIAATGSAPNASGWKGLVTLDGGSAGKLLPATIQNPGPILAQSGIFVCKIMLVVADSSVATVAGQVSIQNPNDNTFLYPQIAVTVVTPPAPGVFLNENLVDNVTLTWKDFIVTGLTATKTALFIWYR